MNPRENVWRSSQVGGVTTRTLARDVWPFDPNAWEREMAFDSLRRHAEETFARMEARAKEERRIASQNAAMLAQYFAEFTR